MKIIYAGGFIDANAPNNGFDFIYPKVVAFFAALLYGTNVKMERARTPRECNVQTPFVNRINCR